MTTDEQADAGASAVSIDETRLDKEWIGQAETFYDAAVELAHARSKVAEAKAALDVMMALCAKKIRKNPEKYDLMKVTESAVEEAILLTEDHTKALAKLNGAKYHQDLCQALVDALDHKKKALESLAYLHGQNYFSAPKEPKSTPAMDAAAAKAREKKKSKP